MKDERETVLGTNSGWWCIGKGGKKAVEMPRMKDLFCCNGCI